MKTYDFIVAGGGMAGLSLAYHLNESELRQKKILIIDREIKSQNDHTWCFWEKEHSPFEEIVFHKWKSLWFHGSGDSSKLLDISPFEYKMIQATDFYRYINKKLVQNKNFEFLTSEIKSVSDGRVTTDRGVFKAAEYVFDSSSLRKLDNPKYHNLLQHFLGWKIEAPTPCFDPGEATLFDFRVAQNGDCRFVYVLPFSATKALVEYTVFSNKLLQHQDYEVAIRKYLSLRLQIEDFKITETEFGVIPMSDDPFDMFPHPKTIRIGTAGGFVKPSTGYSFSRTQRRLAALVDALARKKKPSEISILNTTARKRLLDSILLDVLDTKRHPAADVFTKLFTNNKAADVLRFLDEDSSFMEDLKIMRSVPVRPFLVSAAKELYKKI